jgi:hypothetical protein
VITWEFPVLAKYRFAVAVARPFLEAGPSLRTTGNLNSANPSHYGFTGGVGIETHWKNVNIAPVIRYTRWAPESHVADVKAVANQLELLVGFSGTQDSNLHPLGGRVSLGAIAGLTLSGIFRSRTNRFVVNDAVIDTFSGSGTRSYLPGAMIELQLPGRFSVEGDVIYEPLKSISRTVVVGTPAPGFLPGSSEYASPEWKFPVLAKYRFHRERLKPLIELGPSFRLPEGQSGFSHYGATAGFGFEPRMRKLKIAPVLRYTRWGPEKLPEFAYEIRNQLEFLTAFSF